MNHNSKCIHYIFARLNRFCDKWDYCACKYCLSNSAFSPTYDEIILLICFCFSKSPSPNESTPALLLTTVRS